MATAIALIAAGAGRASSQVTAPTNSAPPAISGPLRQGHVLVVSSRWDGSSPIDLIYQWQRCDASGAGCANIDGATSQAYLLVAADVGATIRVTVTATNSAGTLSVLSGTTAVVLAPPAAPTSTVPPSLSGTAAVESTLSVGTGSWKGDQPIAYSYQWQRCTLSGVCQAIVGALSPTYTPVSADSGKQLRTQVTATNSISSVSALSNLSEIVTGGTRAPASTRPPALTGQAQVGQTLAVSTGEWSGTPPFTFAYRWQRCTARGSGCTDILEATTRSYTMATADAGKRLRALVTAFTSGGAGQSATGLSVIVGGGEAAPSNAVLPRVEGIAEIGQTLLAANGQWVGAPPLAYSYQWRRCRQPGGCEKIPAATSRAYRPGTADRGATLQVVVTVRTAIGSASATSAPSATVAAAGSQGAIVLGDGRTSVPTSSLAPPDRLVVDRVELVAAGAQPQGPLTVRIRIGDLHGRVVRGALVQVVTVPFAAVEKAAAQTTGRDGWVVFRLRPTGKPPLPQGSPLVLFVRARKQGESPLAGISGSRLAQLRIG